MQAYMITLREGATPIPAATFQKVREVIRQRVSKEDRDQPRITLNVYPHDHETFVGLLAGVKPDPIEVKRKWRVGVRGRLIEIPVTED